MKELKLKCRCGTIVASVDTNLKLSLLFAVYYTEIFFDKESSRSYNYLMCKNCGERYTLERVLDSAKMRLSKWSI
ncbi:MAG: hypothetical protein QXT58_05690 [Archaeoglobaceae archaeon]